MRRPLGPKENMMTKRPTIVCVDDETVVLTTLKEQLKRITTFPFDLEVASSGEEALEIINDLLKEGIEIPLLISDQTMPKMKGDVLLKEVYQLNPSTLHILLMGLADADAEAVGNAVNFGNLFRFLSKPWDEKLLHLYVDAALSQYEREKFANEYNKKITQANVKLIAMCAKLQFNATILKKFVPLSILRYLDIDENNDNIKLGLYIEKKFSILLIGINNFTTISEKLSVEETFDYINQFTHIVSPIAKEHAGLIQKYMSDAITVLFESASSAVKMATDVIKKLNELTQERVQQNLQPIHVSVGISTGDVGVGMVGETSRVEVVVMGNATREAKQLESFSREAQSQILISKRTYEDLDDTKKSLFESAEIQHTQVYKFIR